MVQHEIIIKNTEDCTGIVICQVNMIETVNEETSANH